MRLTTEEAVEVLSERLYENTRDIKQKNRQRRNTPSDVYGIEFTRQGDANTPATFYLSVSPDKVYLERFEFKLIVQPFASTNGTGTETASVAVNNRSLAIENNDEINPNPHNHTTQPHNHNLVTGLNITHTTASDFRISIDGIDVTPYLMAQHGWIDGEGVYPSLDINESYDMMKVASVLEREGRETEANRILSSEYKPVRITSNSPFQITLVLYLKYSNMNR